MGTAVVHFVDHANCSGLLFSCLTHQKVILFSALGTTAL